MSLSLWDSLFLCVIRSRTGPGGAGSLLSLCAVSQGSILIFLAFSRSGAHLLVSPPLHQGTRARSDSVPHCQLGSAPGSRVLGGGQGGSQGSQDRSRFPATLTPSL